MPWNIAEIENGMTPQLHKNMAESKKLFIGSKQPDSTGHVPQNSIYFKFWKNKSTEMENGFVVVRR